MEKNVLHKHYKGFEWKRMLVTNLMPRFEMKEDACHEHYEDEYEIICTGSY